MLKFQTYLDENSNKDKLIAVTAIKTALNKDHIPFNTSNNKGSVVLTVKGNIVIAVSQDGDISYKHKGVEEDLVFEKPNDIAYKIVDLINQEGLGDSAFGIF